MQSVPNLYRMTNAFWQMSNIIIQLEWNWTRKKTECVYCVCVGGKWRWTHAWMRIQGICNNSASIQTDCLRHEIVITIIMGENLEYIFDIDLIWASATRMYTKDVLCVYNVYSFYCEWVAWIHPNAIWCVWLQSFLIHYDSMQSTNI